MNDDNDRKFSYKKSTVSFQSSTKEEESQKMRTFLLLFILNIIVINAQNLFPLSIIHINDLHAKYEETNLEANTCKNLDECIGGYARVVKIVRELRANSPNPLYLNAADNFQGTLWYIMFKWNVTQYFLNLEPADVMVSCFNFKK